MEDFVNLDLMISKYVAQCDSLFQELDKYVNEDVKRVKKEQEALSSMKKNVERARQKKEERRNKFLKVVLEERTLRSEMEALKSEIEEYESNNALLKEEIHKMTIENTRLKHVHEDAKDGATKTFQALVAAMTYFKMYLKCYIDLDSKENSAFSFRFFHDGNEIKPLSECNYWVMLRYNGEEWEVSDMKPSVSCKENILGHLKETNDITGFLAHVHDLYLEHKKTLQIKI